VKCPYLNKEVAFNSKGIRHLKFKSDTQARPHADQYARLKLLYLAPKIVAASRTVQGICKMRHFETEKMHSRWEDKLRDVTYYEFIAVMDNLRVKVIVKQVGTGEPYFWSIIPYWGVDDTTHKRILHSGRPDKD
jgi:hypothetical protein